MLSHLFFILISNVLLILLGEAANQLRDWEAMPDPATGQMR
jgi:hypothetical protein